MLVTQTTNLLTLQQYCDLRISLAGFTQGDIIICDEPCHHMRPDCNFTIRVNCALLRHIAAMSHEIELIRFWSDIACNMKLPWHSNSLSMILPHVNLTQGQLRFLLYCCLMSYVNRTLLTYFLHANYIVARSKYTLIMGKQQKLRDGHLYYYLWLNHNVMQNIRSWSPF